MLRGSQHQQTLQPPETSANCASVEENDDEEDAILPVSTHFDCLTWFWQAAATVLRAHTTSPFLTVVVFVGENANFKQRQQSWACLPHWRSRSSKAEQVSKICYKTKEHAWSRQVSQLNKIQHKVLLATLSCWAWYLLNLSMLIAVAPRHGIQGMDPHVTGINGQDLPTILMHQL